MSASGYSKTETEMVGQCSKGWLADLFVKCNYFIFDEKRERSGSQIQVFTSASYYLKNSRI